MVDSSEDGIKFMLEYYNWEGPDILMMREAGFKFIFPSSGETSSVVARCELCEITLHGWISDNTPKDIHAYLSPTCSNAVGGDPRQGRYQVSSFDFSESRLLVKLRTNMSSCLDREKAFAESFRWSTIYHVNPKHDDKMLSKIGLYPISTLEPRHVLECYECRALFYPRHYTTTDLVRMHMARLPICQHMLSIRDKLFDARYYQLKDAFDDMTNGKYLLSYSHACGCSFS
jgi:hypothetical protein